MVLYTERKARAPKPHEVGSMSEKQLPILMACRYEVDQLRAVPDIPYHIDKRVMGIDGQ